MGIHFYKKNNIKQGNIFVISDELYETLEEVFDVFENKTGIFIAPYGKVNLYPDNLKYLYDIIKINLNEYPTSEIKKDINNFLEKILACYEAGISVEAVGD